MKKVFASLLFITLFSHAAFAQEDAPAQVSTPHEKIFDHYIGVQMNQLIRQVFNFNNSTTTNINNPYLMTYSINMRKTGWGLRVGVGYNYNSTTADDGITKTVNSINDMQLRLGIEKAFIFSNKWSAGAGLDGLYNLNDDKTTTSQNNAFDTSTSVVHTTIGTYGAGGMGWLRYNVTKNILIGTEVSFYYTTGKQKQTVNTSSMSGGTANNSTSNSNTDISQGAFSLPVAFFLTIKF